MKKFNDWSLLSKLLSVSSSIFLLVALMMLWIYSLSDKKNTINAYVEKARTICLTAESTRIEMEKKWEQGIFTAEMLIQIAKEDNREKLLATVPVVSAWNSAMRKADEGSYQFRTPKYQPRNPKNEPDYGLDYQIEGPAIKKIKAENLKEYYVIDKKINSIRYFLPVKLSKTCLLCHGDPAQSKTLWGRDDFKDPTGGTIENWKEGEIHGAFEVIQSLDEADSLRASRLIEASTIVFLAIIASSLIYFFIAKNITNSIAKTVDFAKRVSKGDFTQTLDMNRQDEVGILASAMNNIVVNLGQMFKELMDGVETLTSSSKTLIEISEHVHTNATNTSDKSNTVAAAAEEMSSNMDTVSAAVEETSTNVSSVASAAEEMSTTINEIAQNSDKSRAITAEAVKQTHSASAKVDELGEAAEGIGEVTETITAISDKTNLLALNATIEAARAGDAGKGFAVVATEIKALAQQTSEATLEIRQRIDGIQKSTADTVKQIQQITEVINDVNEIVTAIASTVEEQNKATIEIAANISEASIGIQEVTQNVAQSSEVSNEVARDVGDVNQSASEISNSSAQVKLSAEELSKLAVRLRDLVSQFKI